MLKYKILEWGILIVTFLAVVLLGYLVFNFGLVGLFIFVFLGMCIEFLYAFFKWHG
ncbi:hypothetical protein [Methylomonas sp. MgM2]